jgi:hypothetical protein
MPVTISLAFLTKLNEHALIRYQTGQKIVK